MPSKYSASESSCGHQHAILVSLFIRVDIFSKKKIESARIAYAQTCFSVCRYIYIYIYLYIYKTAVLLFPAQSTLVFTKITMLPTIICVWHVSSSVTDAVEDGKLFNEYIGGCGGLSAYGPNPEIVSFHL